MSLTCGITAHAILYTPSASPRISVACVAGALAVERRPRLTRGRTPPPRSSTAFAAAARALPLSLMDRGPGGKDGCATVYRRRRHRRSTCLLSPSILVPGKVSTSHAGIQHPPDDKG